MSRIGRWFRVNQAGCGNYQEHAANDNDLQLDRFLLLPLLSLRFCAGEWMSESK
jgi:hypothetical protein